MKINKTQLKTKHLRKIAAVINADQQHEVSYPTRYACFGSSLGAQQIESIGKILSVEMHRQVLETAHHNVSFLMLTPGLSLAVFKIISLRTKTCCILFFFTVLKLWFKCFIFSQPLSKITDCNVGISFYVNSFNFCSITSRLSVN